MTTIPRFDVLGIGNAIVDVIASGTDEGIAALGLEKGTMKLVDAAQSAAIYSAMGSAVESSGGSVCNSLAALCSLGGSASLIARTGPDDLGAFFAHDMRAVGVDFPVRGSDGDVQSGAPVTAGMTAGTGRCLIQVTPDGERTMATYLGASIELDARDVERSKSLFASANLVFFDGYLLDSQCTRGAVAQALHLAHLAGTPVATSLGDRHCVARNRAGFQSLIIEGGVRLLFANEREITALTGIDDIEQSAIEASQFGATVVVTLGPEGCLIRHAGRTYRVPCAPVDTLVDTTGAGDSFAAGFTYGWTRAWPIENCAELGALAASRIISQVGARPLRSLSDLPGKVSLPGAA